MAILRSHARAALLAIGATAMAAAPSCYQPQLEEGRLRCRPERATPCPQGLQCLIAGEPDGDRGRCFASDTLQRQVAAPARLRRARAR